MIVALAGRRIDAKVAPDVSFPLSNSNYVKKLIGLAFKNLKITTLICSGANGADLLALQTASEMRVQCYLVLPFEPKEFKKSSVTDRPGNWGRRFDKILNALDQKHKIFLDFDLDDVEAFRKTNLAILDETDRLAIEKKSQKIAIVIWDGKAKIADDATEHFRLEALRRNYKVIIIYTIHDYEGHEN